MKKEDSGEQFEKESIQELKDKVLDVKNEKERKKHYTKYILARERLRVREQQDIDNELRVKGNDEGS